MAVIGIDLDHTAAHFEEWKGGENVGPPNQRFVELMNLLFLKGHTLCIWSCRADYVVENWLVDNGLRSLVHFINCSPYPTESGKASFDFYIGDEAIRWQDNVDEILTIVQHAKTHDFDRETAFSSHNPRQYLSGVGRAYVDMFEKHWKAAWFEHDRKGRPYAFLTICSHAKPYSKSFIHASIRSQLYDYGFLGLVDYIHISNAGIIPASAEMKYPFNAYDWNGDLASPEVKEYHKAAIERRLRAWLDIYGNNYERQFVYLRGNGNTCDVVRKVLPDYPKLKLLAASWDKREYPGFMETQDIDDCLTSRANLGRLTDLISKENKYGMAR